MSVDWYLVCHACRRRVHVAQDRLSGWTFYSGEPEIMATVSAWLKWHGYEYRRGHNFVVENEHEAFSQDYPELTLKEADPDAE